MGHELPLKFLLVGIKILDHPKLLNILYVLENICKNMYQMCLLLPSNSKI